MRLFSAIAFVLLSFDVARGQALTDIQVDFHELIDLRDVRISSPNIDNFFSIPAISNEMSLAIEGDIKDFNFRASLVHQYSVNSRTLGDLDLRVLELSKTVFIDDRWSVFGGKRNLNWDVASASFPVGFFQFQPSFTDFTDRFNRAEGLPLLGVNYLGDNYDITAVISEDFGKESDGFNQGLTQWAGNLTLRTPKGPFSLIFQQAEDQNLGVGFAASQDLRSDIVTYQSGFIRRGTRRPIASVLISDNSIAPEDGFGSFRINDGRYYFRGVIGATIAFPNSLTTSIEYSYDRRGLNTDQWESFVQFVEPLNSVERDQIDFLNLGNISRSLTPSGARRHYGFIRASYQSTRWELSSLARMSLSDRSFLSSTQIIRKFKDGSIGSQASIFSGHESSEFGLNPIRNSINFFITCNF